MRSTWHRAVFVSFVLVMSSLAGCLGGDDDDKEDGKYGTVMVSTYHIAEIVTAIAGDTVNVEMISLDNIPVHDFAPEHDDLVRLADSDLFLSHGLGLEPWVDEKLADLGDNAPKHYEIHTMPTGEIALDYEGMLIDTLCKSLNSPSVTVVNMLAEHPEDASELHGDDGAYNMAFPEEEHHDEEHHDEEHHHEEHHDEEHQENGDHNDHEGHDHGGREMLEAEDELTASEDCPTGTVIPVYHFEEGEYMLEFRGEDVETFMMAIAAMGGAHHHHEHENDGNHSDEGHDEDRDREEGDHDDGDHDDREEGDHDGHGHGDNDREDGDHDHDDEGGMSAQDAMAMFDSNNDNNLSLEEFLEGMESMEDEEEHDHEEHQEGCHDTTTHETHDEYTNQADCEAAGHMWMEDHDEHGCHDTTTHETHDEYTNQADCEAAGHMWMEDDGHDEEEHGLQHELIEAVYSHYFSESDSNNDTLLDMTELETLANFMDNMNDGPDMDVMMHAYISVLDEDGDGVLSISEFSELMEEMMHDDHDDHHGHEDGGDHEDGDHEDGDNGDDNHSEDENMTEMMFEMFDENGDQGLNESELHELFEMMRDEDHDDHDDHEEGGAFIGLHIEREGEYGIALPEGVELHVLTRGGHEGHDHGGHGDHSDHEEDDHSDEANDSDVDLSYDPHSWLDPVAFAAQVDLVLGHLIETFPEGEKEFKSNANEYKAELVKIDTQFKSLADSCQNMTVAANHNAYSYLAYRYDIDFVTVHGLDPEGEPSPEDLKNVVETINEKGITILYIEEYTDESSVDSIKEDTGVTTKILYTMEMAPQDDSDDYLSLMTKNYENLRAGMSCSA